MPTLAHLSDVHSTRARIERAKHLVGNRGIHWISSKVKHRRRRKHRNEILEALALDLIGHAPGQVVVTGDITSSSSIAEYTAVAAWLEQHGDPGWLTGVPGNHDAFLRDAVERAWQHWAGYVSSDEAARRDHPAVPEQGFPTLRIRDGLALVGVCSARPSPLGLARGKIGAEQMRRLEELLNSLRDHELCRVVLTHYPPFDEGIPWRRRLRDSRRLRGVLERAGAELVLHGHLHHTSFASLPGRDGEIQVVGVPCAADPGGKDREPSGYHIYRIEERPNEESGLRYSISVLARGYDSETRSFVTKFEREL